MKLKSVKILGYLILFIFWISHFSEALNYSNSIDFYNESSELISKKGSGGKKGVELRKAQLSKGIIKNKLN